MHPNVKTIDRKEVTTLLTKGLLKKMFLKVLYEVKEKGYTKCTWESKSIIRYGIPDYFKINALSGSEYSEALDGVVELENESLIRPDPDQSTPNFKVLTSKGKQIVEKDIKDMKLPSIDINKLLTRDDLRNKVFDDYVAGRYENAISNAFKLFEEAVRSKANLPADSIGADLMVKAFNSKDGVLKHPNAKMQAESEALMLLMRGAIMWFKNPSSHRTVGYNDAEEAAQILAFANLLLNMVDQCSCQQKPVNQ